MKMKRIAAWILALSLCISNSGLVYAAENTGMEEKSRTQEVQQEEKNFVKNIFSCSSSFTSVFEQQQSTFQFPCIRSNLAFYIIIFLVIVLIFINIIFVIVTSARPKMYFLYCIKQLSKTVGTSACKSMGAPCQRWCLEWYHSKTRNNLQGYI